MPACKKVLLIAPPSNQKVYKKGGINVGTPQNPGIALAQIAAILLEKGHAVRILDLDRYPPNTVTLVETLSHFVPDIVGVTATTPSYTDMVDIVNTVKSIDQKLPVVLGGPHVTVFPEQSLIDSGADIAVVGEGDYTLIELIEAKKKEDVPGIVYRQRSEIRRTKDRPLLNDLDLLPYPAWNLYDLKRYRGTKVIQRNRPSGSIETSRGCPFNCVFCNKLVFRHKFRTKSPARVASEVEHMLASGFREIHIEDDGFSTDLSRAKEICRQIIIRNLNVPWTLKNGIRVDRVDPELLELMKQAGCYQVAYGIESGNQSVLNGVGKNITLNQVQKAVNMAKRVGLETYGFFMLGLPGETEETLQDTINFALELDMDIVKFSIFTPLPGTPLFEQWQANGSILTTDWSKYSFHNLIDQVYRHPGVDHDTLRRYYKEAYRRYYLRWHFIWRRAKKDFSDGRIIWDAKYFLQMKW